MSTVDTLWTKLLDLNTELRAVSAQLHKQPLSTATEITAQRLARHEQIGTEIRATLAEWAAARDAVRATSA